MFYSVSLIICFSDHSDSDLVMINDDDICDLLDIDKSDAIDENNWEKQNDNCEAVLSNIEFNCVVDNSIFTGKLEIWIIF